MTENIAVNPQRLPGPWLEGFALDIHKVRSTFAGYNEFGHAQFDTTRSPVGELVFRLKYRGDETVIPVLVNAVETFWKTWQPSVDAIVPVPPSIPRRKQPVIQVAEALSERLKIPLCTECVTKVKQTPQLKNFNEYNKRIEALKDAFAVTPEATKDRRLLLFDDLHDSGATVRMIAELLQKEGGAEALYLLTLTRT